jgi:hypothetical protein
VSSNSEKPAVSNEPVAKLPRGRGLTLSTPQLFRIAMTLTLLVAVVLMAKPCAHSVSSFVTNFGPGAGSGSALPAATSEPAYDYVPISTDMTPAEIKAAIDEARRKHASQGLKVDAVAPVGSSQTPSDPR